jgi:hypothetical protein
VVARGAVHQLAPQPIGKPFASGRVVEGGRARAIVPGPPEPAPEGVGFVDGIQRYVVDGHFGLVPVMRAYVDAAVLERHQGRLRAAARVTEEFLVVPADRLTATQRAVLEGIGLPVHESRAGERPHPLVDRWAAVQVLEERRDACEQEAAGRFLAARPDTWLFVDGGVRGVAALPGAERVVGLVKQHETQFLDGADLEIALTLAPFNRSRVFARSAGPGVELYSWYLRLWPWSEEDLLHGLIRLERAASAPALAEADLVSRWLLAERTPLATPDPRWDRLIYPMHEVETFLRAHAGGWS